jgi:hypothetical protein
MDVDVMAPSVPRKRHPWEQHPHLALTNLSDVPPAVARPSLLSVRMALAAACEIEALGETWPPPEPPKTGRTGARQLCGDLAAAYLLGRVTSTVPDHEVCFIANSVKTKVTVA